MNLVEEVGSGLLRIRQMCEAYPCPPPRISIQQKIVAYWEAAQQAIESTNKIKDALVSELNQFMIRQTGMEPGG